MVTSPTPAAVIAEGVRLTQDYYANPTCNVRRRDAEHWLVMHGHALLAVAEAAATLCTSENTERRPDFLRAFADDDALASLIEATARLAPATKEDDTDGKEAPKAD